jgi:phosphonate C-P lyase system protein PhnH
VSTDLLGPARISGDLSQQVFDTLLRTIAEPGTVRRLPEALDDRIPKPLWLPLALTDVDVGVHVDDMDWSRLVRTATSSPVRPLSSAPFVVLPTPTLDQIDGIAIGTALRPEDGARVALPVERLIDSPDHATGVGSTHRLEGPGIRDHRLVTIVGLEPAIVARLGTGSGPRPTGFDTWLFTPEGDVMAIPRTTHLTETS